MMESCILLHPPKPAGFPPGDCRGRETVPRTTHTQTSRGAPLSPSNDSSPWRISGKLGWISSSCSPIGSWSPGTHCPRGQSPQHPQSNVPRVVAVFMYVTKACQSRGTEPEPCCATCCSNGELQKKVIPIYINKPGTSPLGFSEKKKKSLPFGMQSS